MLAVEGGDRTDHCKMSAMQDTLEERITCDVHVVSTKFQHEFDHSLCSLPSSVHLFSSRQIKAVETEKVKIWVTQQRGSQQFSFE